MTTTSKALSLALLAIFVLFEPALANKFETMSSGLTGSSQQKREFIQNGLLIGGGLFWLFAVLAVIVPHANASHLNYSNWKTSAAVLAVFGSIMLLGYFLM